MLAAKQTVLRRPAAGAQKQGHVDPEGLLKQGQHPCGMTEATGADGATHGLAGLIGEGGEELVQTQLLQGLGWRGAADARKAELQAFLAGGERLGQLAAADRLAKVLLEILQRLGDDLDRISADKRGRT